MKIVCCEAVAGQLARRDRHSVRKLAVVGALAGALITILIYFAAASAARSDGGTFCGLHMATPEGIVFEPSGWLVRALRLPIEYWNHNWFIPGRSGVIFATLVNSLVLSGLGTVLGWLWHRLRKRP